MNIASRSATCPWAVFKSSTRYLDLTGQPLDKTLALSPPKTWLKPPHGKTIAYMPLPTSRQFKAQSAQQNQRLHFESGSLTTLIRLVEQGSGFTIVPYLELRDTAVCRAAADA